MTERHTSFFVKDIESIKFCGTTVLNLQLDGAFEIPFETEPTEGAHDFRTCENCQKYLAKAEEILTERFNGTGMQKGFPYCCEPHSKLVTLKMFRREAFMGVPGMTARKILYTYNHIINHHHLDEYYKDITDYIEYTILSFGQMPHDAEALFLGYYIEQCINLLEKCPNVPQKKKDKILNYFKRWKSEQSSLQEQDTDLNILAATYQKWFKIFPFDISFFSELKPRFESYLPILHGTPIINKYSGSSKVKIHTKDSLIEELLDITNTIITQINSHSLYQEGKLDSPEKLKLELILNERSMKIGQGYANNSKNEEDRYRKILKEWFNDEKNFITEITPLLKSLPSKTLEKSSFSVLEWATVFYYADGTKYLNESTISAKIKEFQKKHNIDYSNDSFYNKYNTVKKRVSGDEQCGVKELSNMVEILHKIQQFMHLNYNKCCHQMMNDIDFINAEINEK